MEDLYEARVYSCWNYKQTITSRQYRIKGHYENVRNEIMSNIPTHVETVKRRGMHVSKKYYYSRLDINADKFYFKYPSLLWPVQYYGHL